VTVVGRIVKAWQSNVGFIITSAHKKRPDPKKEPF